MSVLVVDAIFRGSRLFYSWIAFDALQAYGPVHILTRSSFRTPLYTEMFAGSSPVIHDLIPLPEDFWYGKLSKENLALLVKHIEVLDNINGYEAIYFAGINEYFPEILDLIGKKWSAGLKRKPIVAVEYESKPFLKNADIPVGAAEQNSLKARVEKYRGALTSIPGLKLAFLDERMADPEEISADIDPSRYFVMPDPIPDKASNRIADTITESCDFVTPGDSPAVLLVGVQSERKGLRDVVRALRADDLGRPEPRFFLSGRLEPAMQSMAAQVKGLKRRLSWRDTYVSEKDVRKSYKSTDFVMMPYTKGFSGSSGVMAYATAFGKPMLTTNHGCIGYRVRKFGLGMTFSSGEPSELADLIKGLPNPKSERYKELKQNCLDYAERNSIKVHQQILVSKLLPRAAAADTPKTDSDIMNPAIKLERPVTAQPRFSLDISHVLPMERKSLSPATVKETPLVALLDTSVSSLNMGDHVIMDCVRHHLRKTMPAAVFANMATHDYMGSEGLRIADSAQLRIVGGTNLLASHMDDYKQWKVGGNEMLRLKDVVLCGVGWWQYQDIPNSYTRVFLRSVLSKDKMHSVRDSLTARQLKSIGVTNVLNTACVTMWSLTDDHLADIPTEKAENVITTFTDYKPDATNDRAMYEVLKRHYKKVYFWLQGRADYEYSKEILGPDVEFVGPTLDALDDALENIDSLDYVGNRLHAGIRSLQHKRRTLIVSVDNRATEISRDTNLPVIERGDMTSLLRRVTKPQQMKLKMPWDDIRAYLGQFV